MIVLLSLIVGISSLPHITCQGAKPFTFFNWTDTTSANSTWRWAPDCDLWGNDIITFPCPASSCGQECHVAPSCTHFAWAANSGGQCWLKKGPFSQTPLHRTDNGYFCGFIPNRETNLEETFTWTDSPLGDTGVKVRWAGHCNMEGNDLVVLKTGSGADRDLCSRSCHENNVCTHFVTSTEDGGTCWLKGGAVPGPSLAQRIVREFFCGFLVLQSGNQRHEFGPGSRQLNWVEGSGDEGNVRYRWAQNCDLSGNDIQNFLTKRDNCGAECSLHKECTHFAWSNVLGGSCWIKRGTVPNYSIRTDSGYVCGHVTFRKGEEVVVPERKEQGGSTNVWIIWVVIGLLAIAGVLSATIFGLRQRKISESKLLRGLDREEIDEFFLGRPELLARNTNMTNETVAFLPYDQAYEVGIEDIECKRFSQ